MREPRFHAWFIRSYVEFVWCRRRYGPFCGDDTSHTFAVPVSQQKWKMKWRCLLHINNTFPDKCSFVVGLGALPKTLCTLSDWRCQKVISLFFRILCAHFIIVIFFCFSVCDTRFFGPKAHFQWQKFAAPSTRSVNSCFAIVC